ncbi:MAG: type VI secretion system protein TssA [Pseudomonadota bacterium]
MHDVDALLRPISDDEPSGPDMEYESEFTALFLAAQPGAEQEMGDSVIEATEPDWAEVSRQCGEILKRTHDLRVGVVMAQAVLKREGWTAFAEATRYLKGLIDERWETCHPQLDAEDDNDPTMRANAMRNLCDNDGLLKALHRQPLTESRMFGRMALRDLEVASGDAAQPKDMEKAPDMTEVAAAFTDTGNEKVTEIRDATAQARDHLKEIAKTFDAQIGGLSPDLAPIVTMMTQIASEVDRYCETPSAGEAEDETAGDAAAAGDDGVGAGAGVGSGGRAATVAVAAPGTISSREDVDRALGKIIDYYNKNEPSSPLPMILARARRLVTADFMTIMQDLAPAGVSEFTVISGVSPTSSEDEEDEEESSSSRRRRR